MGSSPQSRASAGDLKLRGGVRRLGDHRKGDHLYLQCQVGGYGGFTGGMIGLLFWLPFIQGLAGLHHLGAVRPERLG